MARQCSGLSAWNPRFAPNPAFATTTSMPPNASTAASASARTWSHSVTSHGTASARPDPPSSAATASMRSADRAASTTRCPAAAAPRAIASPMPLDAPVTSTTRPSSRHQPSRRRAYAPGNSPPQRRGLRDRRVAVGVRPGEQHPVAGPQVGEVVGRQHARLLALVDQAALRGAGVGLAAHGRQDRRPRGAAGGPVRVAARGGHLVGGVAGGRLRGGRLVVVGASWARCPGR